MPLLLRRQLVIMPLLLAALQVRERKVCFHSDLHRPWLYQNRTYGRCRLPSRSKSVADEPQGKADQDRREGRERLCQTKCSRPPLPVVGLGHEQSVPIFQQLAGG